MREDDSRGQTTEASDSGSGNGRPTDVRPGDERHHRGLRPDGGMMAASLDGEALLDDLGVDAEGVQRRKAFVGMTAADERRLADLEPTVDGVVDDVVEGFYDRLTDNPRAREILDDGPPIEMLKRTQAAYLRQLTAGEYGCEYAARRAKVGKIHDAIGVTPDLYLGAFVEYYEGLLGAVGDRVTEEYGDDDVDEAVGRVLDHALSLLRLLNLDQQFAMETYIHSYSERLEGSIERRERLAREVREEVEGPIDELVDASAGVADTAAEMDDHTDTLSERARTVTEEVSTLSATVEEVAATADQVETRSREAASLADEGRESAVQAATVMHEVGDAADDASTDVGALREQVEHIDEVVEVIDGIADRTNLLALNASIEAARAGEAGDGFAVVADEVKSLAEQASEQATQIEETVSEIQADAVETVESLDRTTGKVNEGVEEVEDARDRLDDIARAVRETADGIEDVAGATDQQAESTERVADMADDVADAAAEVSDRVADIAAANEEQTAMVQEIRETTSRLTDGDGRPGPRAGGGGPPPGFAEPDGGIPPSE